MKTILTLFLLATVIALPGMAVATTVTGASGSADCDGFQVTAQVHWGSALTATLSYVAVLTDDGGMQVASVTGGEVLNNPGVNSNQEYAYTGAWGQQLCGTYTTTVTVKLVAPLGNTGAFETTTASFMATFVCNCETRICNYTPGYWKNHAENWPVMELALGGVNYSQAQLLAIMGTPVRGDATIILAYHLIAAKLNVLGGSDPGIGGAITDADNLLMSYPLGSKPGDPGRSMILDVKDLLADYNELECPDGPISDSGKSFIDDETPSTWGQLKASYR